MLTIDGCDRRGDGFETLVGSAGAVILPASDAAACNVPVISSLFVTVVLNGEYS